MKDAQGHGSEPRGGAAHQEAVKAVGTRGVPPTGDGTFDRYGKTPQQGFMVGGAANSRYTGAWTDPRSGVRYVEKSNRVNSETLARSMGRMRNQISVWDLGRQAEVVTGGTGVYKPH